MARPRRHVAPSDLKWKDRPAAVFSASGPIRFLCLRAVHVKETMGLHTSLVAFSLRASSGLGAVHGGNARGAGSHSLE